MAGLDIDIPGTAARCRCGLTHRVDIRTVAIAGDANERLAAHAGAERWRAALLVMDANTEEAAGSSVARELEGAGLRVVRLRFAARSGLRADDEAVATVRRVMRENEDAAAIAVGSGVITDVVRYAAHLEDRGFVSVPTAASMDGYASSVAAMERRGVKVTFPARAPEAIFADPAVIAAAPPEMTRSGLGDLLGKGTARTDWLAGHLLYGEAFCGEVDARMLRPLTYAAGHADAVLERRAGGGRAAPRRPRGVRDRDGDDGKLAAGERLRAPRLPLLGPARRARPPPARAARAPGRLRDPFRDGPAALRLRRRRAHARAAPPRRATRRGRSRVARRPTARHRRRGDGGKARLPRRERRPLARASQSGTSCARGWRTALQLFPAVESALAAAEIPAAPGFLGLDEATLRATFRYSNRLRARYTTVDFLEGQGALEDALEAALGGL